MALGLGGALAKAGPVPDYGHDFGVIGDPGNRPANIEEGRRFFPPYAPEGFSAGRVDYRYRVARTEVTVGQWLEFVNAYAPYYDGPAHSLAFTGDWIVYAGSGSYRAIEGSENFATNMAWRFAARYCNWLHNGKSLEQAAFENGAYDTSTFGQDANSYYTDQRTHNPDALFWIPTLDEWTKAMHWDLTKNNGEGGYWRYPTSSDTAPIIGPPGFGQTNAGSGATYDVGAYTDVMSPWELFDGSGGESEWLEFATTESGWRYARGTSWALGPSFDEIDRLGAGPPITGSGGLRLISPIPAPGAPATLFIIAAFTPRSRGGRGPQRGNSRTGEHHDQTLQHPRRGPLLLRSHACAEACERAAVHGHQR
ncbi:MAG: SUMF1/EgtB/PvdO family nonheme iron enzyme [Phycisphaerales bacterium]|nr:SUMF1/EgtB/PvdO family nonheme iron enzyme [Phycisphaerales bacterium]